VGATLFRWLEREAPNVLDAAVRGDAASQARLGHGNAMAQPYHHIILPLASPSDRRTEVRWGIEDFRRRFGRDPVGMWLPETAVDRATLQTLAEEGLGFTVLAPHQVAGSPADGLAGRVPLDDGREIAVFVYDGKLSHGVAFGELLKSEEAWLGRLLDDSQPPRLRAIATDAETFGHHHRGAERTLMGVVDGLRNAAGTRVENFASCLARHGADIEVEIVEPSSWSCEHGVERWRAECGCKMAPEVVSQQAWRPVLRDALVWLAGELPIADAAAAPMARGLARDRAAMFTSCAWFFDDIGGLEPIQVMSYAAHAIDIVAATDRERAERLEQTLLTRLADARSNDPDIGDAAWLYRSRIRGSHPLGSPP